MIIGPKYTQLRLQETFWNSEFLSKKAIFSPLILILTRDCI